MKNLKIYFLLSIAILISGCGGIQSSNIAKIKKVGIISNINDTLYISEDSTVIDAIDVSKWNINNYVSNVFSNNIKFINKPLKVEHSTISIFSKYSKSELFLLDERVKIIKSIMKKNKLDTILYIANRPKDLEIRPIGGLGIIRLLFGSVIKKQALCIVDLYQNIDGKVTFSREYMFSITDVNEKIWDENSNTIYKSYVNGLEKNFKNDIKKTIKDFIAENDL